MLTRNAAVFTYKLFDVKTVNLISAPLQPGRNEITVDFDYAGQGYAKGSNLTLKVNDKAVANDHLPASPPAIFSINETFDVGIDTGSAPDGYPEGALIGNPYTKGKIVDVRIELRCIQDAPSKGGASNHWRGSLKRPVHRARNIDPIGRSRRTATAEGSLGHLR